MRSPRTIFLRIALILKTLEQSAFFKYLFIDGAYSMQTIIQDGKHFSYAIFSDTNITGTAL